MAQKTHQFPRVVYIAFLVVLSLMLISPFVIPIALSATVALALYPLQLRLIKKGWQKRHAAALLTLGFTLLIATPFAFFIAKGTMLVTDQLQRFAVGEKLQSQGLQSVVKTIREDVVKFILRYTDKTLLGNYLTEAKVNQHFKTANIYLLDFFQNLASSIPAVVLFLLVMIFCTFSFLKNAASVRSFFQSLFGFSQRRMDQLVGIFLRDARQVYVSNVVTGVIQSLLVATGVYLITKSDWFLVFFVTLIFSFIPVIGAAPMAFLFAVVAFFQDNTTGAIILIALGTFTGLIDNFLRPWLASFGQSHAPPIVSFVFVIGGALMLGFPGLFIGLLVGGIAYDTLPIFWDEIGRGEAHRTLATNLHLPKSEQQRPEARH
jgi:predicted PurR-regulated permease PerM